MQQMNKNFNNTRTKNNITPTHTHNLQTHENSCCVVFVVCVSELESGRIISDSEGVCVCWSVLC